MKRELQLTRVGGAVRARSLSDAATGLDVAVRIAVVYVVEGVEGIHTELTGVPLVDGGSAPLALDRKM